MDNFIHDEKGKEFSDKDISALCEGKVRVVEYRDLMKHNNIDQVLGRYGSAVILYETEEGHGHWCALFRRPGKERELEFFDPYGMEPDSELAYVPDYFRAESGQDFPHLTWLIENSDYRTLVYNDYPLQEMRDDTSTCGRWCGIRIVLKDLTIEQFVGMFADQTWDPDWYVTALTLYVRS